jgi:hypothetical protein
MMKLQIYFIFTLLSLTALLKVYCSGIDSTMTFPSSSSSLLVASVETDETVYNWTSSPSTSDSEDSEYQSSDRNFESTDEFPWKMIYIESSPPKWRLRQMASKMFQTILNPLRRLRDKAARKDTTALSTIATINGDELVYVEDDTTIVVVEENEWNAYRPISLKHVSGGTDDGGVVNVHKSFFKNFIDEETGIVKLGTASGSRLVGCEVEYTLVDGTTDRFLSIYSGGQANWKNEFFSFVNAVPNRVVSRLLLKKDADRPLLSEASDGHLSVFPSGVYRIRWTSEYDHKSMMAGLVVEPGCSTVLGTRADFQDMGNLGDDHFYLVKEGLNISEKHQKMLKNLPILREYSCKIKGLVFAAPTPQPNTKSYYNKYSIVGYPIINRTEYRPAAQDLQTGFSNTTILDRIKENVPTVIIVNENHWNAYWSVVAKDDRDGQVYTEVIDTFKSIESPLRPKLIKAMNGIKSSDLHLVGYERKASDLGFALDTFLDNVSFGVDINNIVSDVGSLSNGKHRRSDYAVKKLLFSSAASRDSSSEFLRPGQFYLRWVDTYSKCKDEIRNQKPLIGVIIKPECRGIPHADDFQSMGSIGSYRFYLLRAGKKHSDESVGGSIERLLQFRCITGIVFDVANNENRSSNDNHAVKLRAPSNIFTAFYNQMTRRLLPVNYPSTRLRFRHDIDEIESNYDIEEQPCKRVSGGWRQRIYSNVYGGITGMASMAMGYVKKPVSFIRRAAHNTMKTFWKKR